jgi:hypothetical protein
MKVDRATFRAASLGGFALCLALALTVGEAGASELEHEVKCSISSDSGASGVVTVAMQGKTVTGVRVFVSQGGRPGEPGYLCVLEVKRDDKDTKWTSRQGAVVVELGDAEEFADGDSLTVNVRRKTIVIDLENTKSGGICGAGAELPTRVEIPFIGRECKAEFRS